MLSAAPPLRATVRLPRPDSPPSPVTAQVTGAARQASVPQSALSAGVVLSMPIMSTRQSDALPAPSTTRVSSLCSPAVLIVTAGVIVGPTSSSLYSVRAIVEPGLGSVPDTVVE